MHLLRTLLPIHGFVTFSAATIFYQWTYFSSGGVFLSMVASVYFFYVGIVQSTVTELGLLISKAKQRNTSCQEKENDVVAAVVEKAFRRKNIIIFWYCFVCRREPFGWL